MMLTYVHPLLMSHFGGSPLVGAEHKPESGSEPLQQGQSARGGLKSLRGGQTEDALAERTIQAGKALYTHDACKVTFRTGGCFRGYICDLFSF